MDEMPGRNDRRRATAEELEEMMFESEEELVAILESYRIDEDAAADLLAAAALATGLDPVAPGRLREVFLDTVERAARQVWARRDPLEDDDVAH
ncbi:MAG TPA: hypothetical protein VM599_04290 [Thermoanaerobaculia bacterium]|nr:hypothetical protein [Thermoanaerobaculia bacterium]